jgi:hypothetical protein
MTKAVVSPAESFLDSVDVVFHILQSRDRCGKDFIFGWRRERSGLNRADIKRALGQTQSILRNLGSAAAKYSECNNQ